MKNNIRFAISLFLLVAFIAPSCLKEKLKDRPLTEAFSHTESDINLQVSGMYADIAQFNCFKNAMIFPLIMGADNLSGFGGDAATFTQKLFTPQARYFTEPWGSFYRVINHANTLLPLIEKADISFGFRDKINGNLYFLRAFCYFNLVRMFGGVPIRTEPVNSQSDFNLPRSSRDEVYTLIFSDLEKAFPLLPLNSQLTAAEFGNASRGSAQAILSLAYLTYGNHQEFASNTAGATASYTKARAFADSVIISSQYSLVSNYADLWDIQKENEAYKEVIFGIPYKRDGGASLSSSLGSEIGTWVRGGGQWRIQPWFYDQCRTGDYVNDYRTDVTFLTQYINETNGKVTVTFPKIPATGQLTIAQPFLNKYNDPSPPDTRNRENDFFIIRLAEVYLIKAEAENELNGPTTDGITAFNKLRERARLANGTPRATPANITVASLTKTTFRQKIFLERGFELCGEGQRWFDLVRMKSPTGTTMYEYQYNTVMPAFPQGLPVYTAATQTWSNRRVAPNSVIPYHVRYLLYPIPTTELGINRNMTPNPGW